MESQKTASSDFGSLFSAIPNFLLTLLYPQSCQICEKSVESKTDGFVCGDCWRETQIFDGKEIICQKCGAFLKNGSTDSEVFCHRCQEDEYDSARSVGLYEKALAVSILNLKIQPYIPRTLQKFICDSFKNSPFQDADLIIPVPLAERRRLERGFNQAAVISRIISKSNDLPFDEISLKRIVHTEKHRAGMDKKSRAESVENAFEVKRPRLVENKNILLVDDVFTSGATVSGCAKVLKKSGANKVYVFTVARAF
ncbi:MAG: double zinc ribbon domain-containing protein [Pyrinomonadaceae bacterium]